MLSPTTPLVMRFVLAAAVTLPAAAYAAEAPQPDAAAKDACEQCAAECTKCGDGRRVGGPSRLPKHEVDGRADA
jgi:hypothetical protein